MRLGCTYLIACTYQQKVIGLLLKKRRKRFRHWFRGKKESFAKGFIIFTGFAYNGKLKIRKVEKNIKTNSDYYQKYILT